MSVGVRLLQEILMTVLFPFRTNSRYFGRLCTKILGAGGFEENVIGPSRKEDRDVMHLKSEL